MQSMQEITTDWQARFRAPAIYWAEIAAHDPTRGLVVANRDGAIQLYAWDVEVGTLHDLPAIPPGQLNAELAPDGRYLYFLQDQGGNEMGHIVRIPFEQTVGAAMDNRTESQATPVVEDVTPDLPPYSPLPLAIARSGKRIAFGIVDETGTSRYDTVPTTADGRLGKRHPLYTSRSRLVNCSLSATGELAVIATNERSQSMDLNLVALKSATGDIITELWDGPGTDLRAYFFSPVAGDQHLVATTSRSGFHRPFLWNPLSGVRKELNVGAVDGEIVPMAWSPDGQTLLLRQLHRAEMQLYCYDLPTDTLRSLAHPTGTYGSLFFGPAGDIIAQWQDAQTPGTLLRLDRENGEKVGTALQVGKSLPGRPWRSIHYPSLDGEMVQAWLATPAGSGPFPTIIEMHGGPTAVQVESFTPAAQSWLDHGFAYLSVNYRGSIGFGQAYQEKIVGRPGHWEVQDIVAARRWLVEAGIARAEQVFLTGWSYGGYLTLLTLGKYPGLWAGGMAGIAITDWHKNYEDCSPLMRPYQAALFGGTPAEKPELHTTASPVTYAAAVDAPILIIQGKNDSRTPARPVVDYETTMRALGKAIDVVWYESGHTGSFTDVEQRVAHQALMLEFAQSICGPRLKLQP